MTENSWQQIEILTQGAVELLKLAKQVLETPAASLDQHLSSEVRRMAVLHAVQSGYAKVEEVMERIAEMRGQQLTSLMGWRRTLVRNLGHTYEDMPPVFSKETGTHLLAVLTIADGALDHRRTISLESMQGALSSIDAVITGFPSAITAYRDQVEAAPTPTL